MLRHCDVRATGCECTLYRDRKWQQPFSWARICKRLWSPGIDSEDSIPQAFVTWRADTTNMVVVPARQARNRYLGSLKDLQIRALDANLCLTPALRAPFLVLNHTNRGIQNCGAAGYVQYKGIYRKNITHLCCRLKGTSYRDPTPSPSAFITSLLVFLLSV